MNKQQNFLEQGFGREKCLFNEKYHCTHYWGVWTMQHCENRDCHKKCCKDCTETCGYRCNAAGNLKEGDKHN